MALPEKAIKVFDWLIFDVYQWEQEMFDGSYKTFEKLKRNDTIDILVVTPDEKILILEEEQPWREPFIWLVWWTCEDWEDPIYTAKRELLEETGLICNDIKLFKSYTISSKIDYKSNFYIASNPKQVWIQNLDVWEKIKIKYVTWEEFLDIISDDKFRVKEVALEFLRYIYLWKENELKKMIFW